MRFILYHDQTTFHFEEFISEKHLIFQVAILLLDIIVTDVHINEHEKMEIR